MSNSFLTPVGGSLESDQAVCSDREEIVQKQRILRSLLEFVANTVD
jgi:hypothetical protein